MDRPRVRIDTRACDLADFRTGYVEALEARVRQMEAMLQSLSAGDPGPHGAASNGAASDGAASKGEGSEQRDRTSSTTRPAPSPFELASNQANCQDDTELVRSRVESLMVRRRAWSPR